MKNVLTRIAIGLLVLFLVSGMTACVNKNEVAETYDFDTPIVKLLDYREEGIKITWGKIDGVENYRVFRKSENKDWEILGDTKDNIFIDENVEKGNTYSYTVRCIDLEGKQYLSGYDDMGKVAEYIMVDTPKLSAISRTSNGIEIKWEKVEGIENYTIYRKTKDSDWKKIDKVSGDKYEDQDLKSGKKYTYTVRCANEDFSVIFSSYDKNGLSMDYVVLDNPVISNVSNAKGGIKITWNEVKGAEKYRVFKKGKDDKWEKVLDTKSTECLDEGVVDGNTYTYTVRCLSDDGEYYISGFDKKGASITYLK